MTSIYNVVDFIQIKRVCGVGVWSMYYYIYILKTHVSSYHNFIVKYEHKEAIIQDIYIYKHRSGLKPRNLGKIGTVREFISVS